MTLFDWLFGTHPLLGYAASSLVLLLAGEAGYYIGVARRRNGHTFTSETTTLETAFLGLLALMIGFTFSIAVDRFDTRRTLLVDESNAMGTVGLRARMLPEPHAGEVRRLLRDYVSVRLNLIGRPRTDGRRLTDGNRSNDLQQLLWQQSMAVTAADTRSMPLMLFEQSMNEMFDDQAKEVEATNNQVPAGVFGLLYAIAMVSVGFNAYAAGLLGKGGRIPNTIAVALIATVIALVGDIDRPLGGLVTFSLQPMLSVLAGLGQ